MSEVSREGLVRAFEGLVDAMVLLEFLALLVNEELHGGKRTGNSTSEYLTCLLRVSRMLMIEKPKALGKAAAAKTSQYLT